MNRIAIGGASVLLLVTAGFFLWQSYAETQDPLPPAPVAAAARPASLPRLSEAREEAPSPAKERSKEEKRFNRADRDKDGRITLAEMLQPRRKAFDKLDANHDGKLSFEEWTVKTAGKFAHADADRNGWLSRAEFASTKRKAKAKAARCACRRGEDSSDGDRQD
jgi:hypothetical protein